VRDALAKVPGADAGMVAAGLRTVFARPSAEAVHARFDRIVATLEPRFPAVAGMLLDAREDLAAFCAFPVWHRRKIWPTNPLERLQARARAAHRRRGRVPRRRRHRTAGHRRHRRTHTTSGPWRSVATPPGPQWLASARTLPPCRWARREASDSQAERPVIHPAGDHFSTTRRGAAQAGGVAGQHLRLRIGDGAGEAGGLGHFGVRARPRPTRCRLEAPVCQRGATRMPLDRLVPKSVLRIDSRPPMSSISVTT
jgi:hypothetical protein